MNGPCAKTTTRCTIIALNGREYVGQNICANPQQACPRLPGEGYAKCVSICQQWGHAEQVAASIVGDRAHGGTAYLEGHTYFCDACKAALAAVGVTHLIVGQPPAPGRSLLAWVYHRTRNGLFSRKRAVRDQALADVNRATQSYAGAWTPKNASDPNQTWTGEQP